MSDDKIAEIKERHFHDERWRNGPSMGCETICPQTHDDRAFLLAEVDRQRADNERLREENKELREANKQLVYSIDALTNGANAEMGVLRAQIGLMFLEGKP